MTLFSTTKAGDKELKELQDAVITLFHSGKLEPQLIALKQYKHVGLTKFDLTWGYIKPHWKKKEIIKNWELGYFEGALERDGELIVFECPFFGSDLLILDLGHAAFLEIPNITGIIKLCDWNQRDVGQMYNIMYKKVKNIMSDIEQLIPHKNRI